MADRSQIAEASKVVAEKLGLHFPESRFNDLSSGILLAASELGFEEKNDQFIAMLIRQKLSGIQLDVLAEKLTIGETYFFREKQALSAFRELIIPALVREREQTTRSIRLWSAGCCSGEEPYTLAMILSEIIPDITTWDITILATDINRRFLAKATKGIYTPWSFRETPIETKKRYFTPTGREFEISKEIRRMVKFQPLNLVEDSFPSERNNTNSMDVIFCRNVLMYFSTETAISIANKFYRSLTDQGWFITSQVELSDEIFYQLTKIKYGNAFFYQKSDKPVVPQQESHLNRTQRAIKPSKKIPTKPLARPKRPILAGTPVSIEHADNKSVKEDKNLLQGAREYADKGDFDNALLSLKRLITTDRANPEAYYLLGMILIEQRDFLQAEEYLKKALYLDPDHLLAHFQMRNLCQRTGKEKQATKHRLNVLHLLKKFEDEEVLTGTEGMTAGNLRHLLQPINTSEYD